MNSSSEILLRQYIADNLKKHAKKHDTFIPYGTAGFRTKAELLDHVMFRMGIVSTLRSKLTQAAIGVMITASHNPEPDNGVKLVDPKGDMLSPEWEILATNIANVGDDELPTTIVDMVKKYSIDWQSPGLVYIARDTRQSSPPLSQAVVDGALSVGCEVVDFGVASTPILHYLVAARNDITKSLGEPTREGYLLKLTSGFREIFGKKETKTRYVPEIKVDGANGVGATVMQEVKEGLVSSLKVGIVNDGSNGQLNHNCGADFVKVQQKWPESFTPADNVRCISLDGDADRIIYFYFDSNGKFRMLDGDKIATLFAAHLGGLVKQSQLSLSIGLVQSAYANGSSTNYITEQLGIPVSCVPTGVKFLHHEALKYDIGVYFEANGHGTTVFSDKAVKAIAEAAQSSENSAAKELEGFVKVINSTVGDAISDALAVEAILYSRDWSIEDWDAKYTDLPNRQLKVLVKDRNAITTTDAERAAVTPDGLQEAINKIVATYKNGRSFVRPSGTEDVVRVYAEADTQENADALGVEVAKVVYDMCEGVGAIPKI